MTNDFIEKSIVATVYFGGDDCGLTSFTFSYDICDPLVITMRPSDTPENQWIFAYDLLRNGLEEVTGIGDVRIWPMTAQSSLFIALTSPDGSSTLKFSYARMQLMCRTIDRIANPTRVRKHVNIAIDDFLENINRDRNER